MQQDDLAGTLRRTVAKFVVGQDKAVELLLAALVARAHVLLEGPPGTAKTLLAAAIARCSGLRFKRVQFTPDLLPGDLVGTSVWLPGEGRFEFRHGPIFTDVLLADELNRAPPKTQAALLEAMQERQATVDGVSYSLGDEFWVLATQNPLELEGTYPLPESQLDRFALKVVLGYPSAEQERQMLLRHRDGGEPLDALRSQQAAVVSLEALRAWQRSSESVHVDDGIIDYIERVVRTTRDASELQWGAGPRAAVALLRCSRGLALVRGRSYVLPDDVVDVAGPALGHRVRLTPEAELAGVQPAQVVARVVRHAAVPSVPSGGARMTVP